MAGSMFAEGAETAKEVFDERGKAGAAAEKMLLNTAAFEDSLYLRKPKRDAELRKAYGESHERQYVEAFQLTRENVQEVKESLSPSELRYANELGGEERIAFYEDRARSKYDLNQQQARQIKAGVYPSLDQFGGIPQEEEKLPAPENTQTEAQGFELPQREVPYNSGSGQSDQGRDQKLTLAMKDPRVNEILQLAVKQGRVNPPPSGLVAPSPEEYYRQNPNQLTGQEIAGRKSDRSAQAYTSKKLGEYNMKADERDIAFRLKLYDIQAKKEIADKGRQGKAKDKSYEIDKRILQDTTKMLNKDPDEFSFAEKKSHAEILYEALNTVKDREILDRLKSLIRAKGLLRDVIRYRKSMRQKNSDIKESAARHKTNHKRRGR